MSVPSKILVAFKTRLVPGIVPDVSQLVPPANYKSEEAITKWRAERLVDAQEMYRLQPYTATFDEVQLADVSRNETKQWKYREPGSGKPSVSAVIAAYLLKQYPNAWSNTTHPDRKTPEAIFIGFDSRLFLKILGIECSLPSSQGDPKKLSPLPLALWYANSDHRDIEEAVKPTDFRFLTWSVILQARGLHESFKDWNGPHDDVSSDLRLTTELAAQLGMLNDG